MCYNRYGTLISASLCISTLPSSNLHVVCRVFREDKTSLFPKLPLLPSRCVSLIFSEPCADKRTGVKQKSSRRYLSKSGDDAKRSSGSVCTWCDGQTIDCLPSVYLYFRAPLRSILPPRVARCTCPIEPPSIALAFRCCGMAT